MFWLTSLLMPSITTVHFQLLCYTRLPWNGKNGCFCINGCLLCYNRVSRYIMPFLSWQQRHYNVNTQQPPRKHKPKKALDFPLLMFFLSLLLPLYVRFITSFILLPHLTKFSSCCCNFFVLWSIYIFLHCTCVVHSNSRSVSWWTTITIVSNSFLLLLLVLRYMKFSRSNLRQVVDSRSVHESKNKLLFM